MKIVRILIGGSGGQGILTLGKLLAFSGIKKNYNVSCLPTYGAEMRGGYIYCFLTIAEDKETFSPVSENCDIGVFLNEQSYKMLKKNLKKDGFLILNSSLIKTSKNERRKIEIPATEIAENIGEIRVANMVMAGKVGKLISEKYLKIEMKDLISEIDKVIFNEETIKLCEIAIKKGWEYGGTENRKDK